MVVHVLIKRLIDLCKYFRSKDLLKAVKQQQRQQQHPLFTLVCRRLMAHAQQLDTAHKSKFLFQVLISAFGLKSVFLRVVRKF